MTPLAQGCPFVLLDDARTGAAHLYRDPVGEITARTPEEVAPALAALRTTRHVAAGYICYEAGLALEPRLAPLGSAIEPLLWFGLFERAELVDPAALLGDPAGAWAGPIHPRIDEAAYCDGVGRVLDYIAAGDIYQANLSFRADLAVAGSPTALYARLRGPGGGGWGGIVHDGTRWLLSCSPELFFTLEQGRLTARPMKGTAPRGADPAELNADAKQRAENLMIVDLLRNDLARVAIAGSVAVPRLFDVETYPTLLQMTSTVTAELADGRDAVDALTALFPCGSVTGAPKIRAMEIIAELETDSRGPYTGAIGRLGPNGDAAFNVAIRTLMIGSDRECAVIGLGSGIVADSRPAAEWRECLAKGAFVTAASTPFDLIETMRFDAEMGLIELERHLGRLKTSAERFGFVCDRHALRNELQAATFRLRDDRCVRVRLSPTGAVAIEVRPVPAVIQQADVALVAHPVARDDFRLAHKTSDREFYDAARRGAGTFEVELVDGQGFVTEGSFTNIFVRRDGLLVTPPLARGLLPGVLRGLLIDQGLAFEGDLAVADLASGFYIGNALRGLIPARLVAGAKASGL